MANLNSIRCCGFDKGYDTLVKSRNGCLNDKALYSSALFSYQVSALSSYVEGVCLTQKQYSDAYQKALLNCGCCMKDIESPKGLPPPPACNYLWLCPIAEFNSPGGFIFNYNINNWTNDNITQYYSYYIEDLTYVPPYINFQPNINPYTGIHGFGFDSPSATRLYVWFLSSTQPLGWEGLDGVSNEIVPMDFIQLGGCSDDTINLCCTVEGDTSFLFWTVYNEFFFTNIGNVFCGTGDINFFQNNLQNMIDVTGTTATATVTVVGSDTFIQLTNVNKAVFNINSFITDSLGNPWYFTECI